MRSDEKGLTLLELVIIVVIIGILASVAISAMLSLREKAHIKTLESDLSAAYKASILYFTDDPDGTITLGILEEYGLNKSENVRITIVDETLEDLLITATHPSVRGVYEVDNKGHIAKQ
jgi:Tfp pilus assembly protein PilE